MTSHGWGSAISRHPGAGRDPERHSLYYEALGPGLRRGDDKGKYGVGYRMADFFQRRQLPAVRLLVREPDSQLLRVSRQQPPFRKRPRSGRLGLV